MSFCFSQFFDFYVLIFLWTELVKQDQGKSEWNKIIIFCFTNFSLKGEYFVHQ
jgi:hypothetical protein